MLNRERILIKDLFFKNTHTTSRVHLILAECMEVAYLDELCGYSKTELFQYRNFGKKSIIALSKVMGDHGLALKRDGDRSEKQWGKKRDSRDGN